ILIASTNNIRNILEIGRPIRRTPIMPYLLTKRWWCTRIGRTNAQSRSQPENTISSVTWFPCALNSGRTSIKRNLPLGQSNYFINAFDKEVICKRLIWEVVWQTSNSNHAIDIKHVCSTNSHAANKRTWFHGQEV